MRLIITLVAATAVFAQQAPDDDPAALLPDDVLFYAEADDVSSILARLRESVLVTSLAEKERGETTEAIDGWLATRVKRAAFAFLGGRKPRPIAILETGSLDLVDALLKAAAPDKAPGTSRVGRFVAIGEPVALERLRRTPNEGSRALTEREGFAEFRKSQKAGAIRFHADLGVFALLSKKIAKPKDAGAALFGAHVLAVAGAAREAAGRIELNDGFTLRVEAAYRKTDDGAAFAAPYRDEEGPASRPMLAPPENCGLRLSISRDVAAFWDRRDAFVAEDGQAKLAEFRNGLTVLLGGLPVEDVAAGLGVDWDFYAVRTAPSDPTPVHRFPAVALVAEVRDPKLRDELLMGFQTTIGVINAQRATENAPRLFQETTQRSGVTITSARFLPSALPDPRDDRAQFQPAAAVVGDRLILASRADLAAALVDRAVRKEFSPRDGGDVVTLTGSVAAAVLRDNLDILAARSAEDDGKPVERARYELGWIASALEATEEIVWRFRMGRRRAELSLEAKGSRLLPRPKPETGR